MLWPLKTKFCEINGKICRSKKDAQTKVNRAKDHGIILRAYQCPLDGWWHLTHQKKYD